MRQKIQSMAQAQVASECVRSRSEFVPTTTAAAITTLTAVGNALLGLETSPAQDILSRMVMRKTHTRTPILRGLVQIGRTPMTPVVLGGQARGRNLQVRIRIALSRRKKRR